MNITPLRIPSRLPRFFFSPPGDLVRWRSAFPAPGPPHIGITIKVEEPRYISNRRTILVQVLKGSGEIIRLPIAVLEVIS